MAAAEKVCKVCGDAKPLDQFRDHDRYLDGKRGDCRTCEYERKQALRPAPNPKPIVLPASFPVAREAWMERARCVDLEPSFFFPHDLKKALPGIRQVCGKCPVRDDCVAYAIKTNTNYGVFGGLTPSERDTVRRRNRRGAVA